MSRGSSPASAALPVPVGPGRFAVPANRWDLAPMPTGVADVSVVIPFFDNQHDLDLVLAALTVQSHPLSRLQVIIADDGSPIPPAVPELALGLDITTVHQEDAGFRAGAARNLGAAKADGRVILFLDGDTVPSPHYVQELACLPTVVPDAVVSGRRRYADLSRWTPPELLAWYAGVARGPVVFQEPAWMTQEYARTDDLLAVHPRSYKYLIGAVLGFSREMFDELRGFDETITGYGGEDYDLTYRAYNAGAVLAHVPEAVAWHDGHDWAGRTAADTQTPQKNREVLMLAQRIPEPSVRGRGQIYAVADVLVTVHADGWTLGAAVQSIRSLLTTLDCAVSIDGGLPETQLLRQVFDDDQRVGATVSPRDLTRSRLHLDVRQPVCATTDFGELMVRMLESDVGRLTVIADGRTVLAAVSNRQRARGHRYRSANDAEHPWFDEWEVDVSDSGAELITDEPKLAAVFGGY